MVQNKTAVRRGRPRAYDPHKALSNAMNAFWRAGYSATSLDDLTEATGMNRPSLYGAFGDKRALYLATMDRYIELSTVVFGKALSNATLEESLRSAYENALSYYLPPDAAQRGCFIINTASVESVTDEEVRTKLREGLRGFDRGLESRIRRAKAEGELAENADPVALALLASSILHSLAVRSRAGD
jgi:AcrR family transcriptional regulator